MGPVVTATHVREPGRLVDDRAPVLHREGLIRRPPGQARRVHPFTVDASLSKISDNTTVANVASPEVMQHYSQVHKRASWPGLTCQTSRWSSARCRNTSADRRIPRAPSAGPPLGRPKSVGANQRRQKPTASELLRAVGFFRSAGQRER